MSLGTAAAAFAAGFISVLIFHQGAWALYGAALRPATGTNSHSSGQTGIAPGALDAPHLAIGYRQGPKWP